jgi:hypothetical protein
VQQASFIGIDARIWQALIAGGVVALGWLVNGWSERRQARRLRAEQLRDAHKALFAEIRDICAAYWLEGKADAYAKELVTRMEADPGFVPFIPRETRDRVFDSVLAKIDILPRQTIDAIVAFYALVHAIQSLAEDMRGERFASFEPQRRVAIYCDWIGLRARAFDYGQRTLKLIDVYAKGGPEAADTLLASFNSPAVGRSFPAGSGKG